MAECYRCGVSDERERLFDAISNKGVVKICKNCANEDGLPLVQPFDLNKPERVKSVYERLSAMANLNPQKHKEMLLEREREESIRRQRGEVERRQKTNLKNVIDSNFEKKKPQPRTDLVNNFHWIIMRMRRSKKLTQKQLAENIGESESIIKSAEEGVILDNADVLIKKLESYLNIKLRKGESSYSSNEPKFVKAGINEDPAKREIRERFEKEANFDNTTTEALTISDLQEIKKKKESENSGGLFSFFKKNKKKEEAKPAEGEELSDEEAEEILFKE
jgi:ribosome-binding protein aMBF1 (putative translation factor)